MFHLVHFECPAQEDCQSSSSNMKSSSSTSTSASSSQAVEISDSAQQWPAACAAPLALSPDAPVFPTETALEAEEQELSD